MSGLRSRIQKAEESLNILDTGIEEYQAALKKWFAGEIEFHPEPLSSQKVNYTEITVMVLHELEKEAKLEGREFEPRFGSRGMTVRESLANEGIIVPEKLGYLDTESEKPRRLTRH